MICIDCSVDSFGSRSNFWDCFGGLCSFLSYHRHLPCLAKTLWLRGKSTCPRSLCFAYWASMAASSTSLRRPVTTICHLTRRARFATTLSCWRPPTGSDSNFEDQADSSTTCSTCATSAYCRVANSDCLFTDYVGIARCSRYWSGCSCSWSSYHLPCGFASLQVRSCFLRESFVAPCSCSSERGAWSSGRHRVEVVLLRPSGCPSSWIDSEHYLFCSPQRCSERPYCGATQPSAAWDPDSYSVRSHCPTSSFESLSPCLW